MFTERVQGKPGHIFSHLVFSLKNFLVHENQSVLHEFWELKQNALVLTLGIIGTLVPRRSGSEVFSP